MEHCFMNFFLIFWMQSIHSHRCIRFQLQKRQKYEIAMPDCAHRMSRNTKTHKNESIELQLNIPIIQNITNIHCHSGGTTSI